jgi:hypothetical protein
MNLAITAAANESAPFFPILEALPLINDKLGRWRRKIKCLTYRVWPLFQALFWPPAQQIPASAAIKSIVNM